MYDPERFGIINTGNPKHADLLLVTGSVNARNASVLETLFDQMPSPKAVVAIGICATSGCVFAEAYNVLGGVDKVLPVDVYVPGCAARPEAILDGILRALDVLERKRMEFKKSPGVAAAEGQPNGMKGGLPMVEDQEMVSIDKKELVGAAAELLASGYRLVQIGCTTLADGYEMNYSFDRDYRFKNLRFTVKTARRSRASAAFTGMPFSTRTRFTTSSASPLRIS